MLNMFRTLILPSSGACDYSVELPHWSYCSWFDVCWSFDVVGLERYPCCRLQPATRIIQQNSHKLLMMDILMSETFWTHKRWNKIASDIKLVFYSSTITMMHGPINIRLTYCYYLSPFYLVLLTWAWARNGLCLENITTGTFLYENIFGFCSLPANWSLERKVIILMN